MIIDIGLKNIKKAKEISLPNGKKFTKDQVRKTRYDELFRNVHEALFHKSSEISFEDEQKIKEAFKVIQFVHQNKQYHDIHVYEHFFNLLRKVEWLKNLGGKNEKKT